MAKVLKLQTRERIGKGRREWEVSKVADLSRIMTKNMGV